MSNRLRCWEWPIGSSNCSCFANPPKRTSLPRDMIGEMQLLRQVEIKCYISAERLFQSVLPVSGGSHMVRILYFSNYLRSLVSNSPSSQNALDAAKPNFISGLGDSSCETAVRIHSRRWSQQDPPTVKACYQKLHLAIALERTSSRGGQASSRIPVATVPASAAHPVPHRLPGRRR